MTQTQIRCAECNRRLADLVNEIAVGRVVVELKCPRCGHRHVEMIRPRTDRTRSPGLTPRSADEEDSL